MKTLSIGEQVIEMCIIGSMSRCMIANSLILKPNHFQILIPQYVINMDFGGKFFKLVNLTDSPAAGPAVKLVHTLLF